MKRLQRPDTVSFPIGPVERIPLGEGRCFRLGSDEVAVFRTRAGDVYAVQAGCTHRGGPLADGLVGGGKVLCPLHGYAFDLATGQPAGHACPALRTYPVTVTGTGEVQVHVVAAGPQRAAATPTAATPPD